VTPAWTDRSVDTNSVLTATGGLAPLAVTTALDVRRVAPTIWYCR